MQMSWGSRSNAIANVLVTHLQMQLQMFWLHICKCI